jgi:hypothetical protein
MNKKAGRADVKEVCWLHVDLDPRAGKPVEEEQGRILRQLEEYRLRPHVVIFSGGGYQTLWLLDEPIPIDGDLAKAEDTKLYNIQLEKDLGGDNCHNIDRVLRVPFTVNVADCKKLDKGRTDAVAYAKWDERDRPGYSIDAFKKAEVAAPRNEPPTTATELAKLASSTAIDLSDTRPLDDGEFKFMCGLPFNVAQRAACTEIRDGSRNEKQIGINTDLVRAGVDDQLPYRIMWDKVHFPFLFDAIHFTPKGGARPKAAEYAERQIIKAKTFAEKERMKSEARVAKLTRCGPENRPEVWVDANRLQMPAWRSLKSGNSPSICGAMCPSTAQNSSQRR